MKRRGAFVVVAVSALGFTPGAFAQEAYPARPIRFVVPFVPGGPSDIQSRLLAEKLRQRLGQPVIVDNRGGAGGTIGMEIAAKAPANGYTLVIGSVGTWAVNPHLYHLTYDSVKDFAPIIQVSTSPGGLFVHTSVPVNNVKLDFDTFGRLFWTRAR